LWVEVEYRSGMTRKWAAIAATAAALLTGCAATTTPAASTTTATPSPTPTKTAIQDALATCGIPETMAPTEDKGHSIELHSGKSYDKITAKDIGCILLATGAPTSVLDKIDATRALDGMQSAKWKGGSMEASWTYHPDNGLNVILTEGQ
jgi:hypothetical protein